MSKAEKRCKIAIWAYAQVGLICKERSIPFFGRKKDEDDALSGRSAVLKKRQPEQTLRLL
jgi:hypothetical protein